MLLDQRTRTCPLPTAAPQALGCARGPVGLHLAMRRSRISQVPMHSSSLLNPPTASSSWSLMLQTERLPRGEAIGLTWSHLHMEVPHLPLLSHSPGQRVLQGFYEDRARTVSTADMESFRGE